MALSSVHAMERLLFFTLLQLAVIVLAARAGGALAQRWGQSAVVGEILVGVLLGPSLFGVIAPQAFETVFRSTPAEPLTLLSQVGLLLLMFQIGLEFDFSHLAQRVHRRTVWAVAAAGLAAPFAIGAALGAWMPREIAGMTTYQLGIFAIFGGFLVGVLLHRETAFVHAWHARVGSFVNVFFVPIFFTLTGLRTDLGALHDGSAWGWCVLLIALATLAKLGACYLAARAVRLDSMRARIIGVLMNTRGLMELIVINVGLEMGMIGREVFTMLVLMALASTVITSPALRRWLPRLQPHGEAAGAVGADARHP